MLGAGGILGEAWMGGLLAGLKDADDFDPRYCEHYVGTSAGSIVAAAMAAGLDPASRLEQLPEQPSVAPAEEQPRTLLGGALRLGRSTGATAFAPLAALALRSTAMSGAAVRRAALSRVPAGKQSLAGLGTSIARLGLHWDGRLLVVAVELETGRRVIFGMPGETDISVPAAVEASCAIPGVFRPIRHQGRTYVDGGAWSLTNLDVAPVDRGTRVLCLNPTGSLGATVSLRGAIGPLSRSVAAVEALSLQRRGASVTTLAPDAEAARAMGDDFMDPRRRSVAQQAGYAQGHRVAGQVSVG